MTAPTTIATVVTMLDTALGKATVVTGGHGTRGHLLKWAATVAASAMEMAITGSVKDIAVNVASKWAKLVSNVVMKDGRRSHGVCHAR